MNPQQLRALIKQGENLDVEFKGEERHPLSDDEIVQAVVCLANRPSTKSGWVLIGVEDDGRVTGARPRHGNRTDPQRLQALITNRTRPSLTVRVFLVQLQPEGVEIIAIEVLPVRNPVATADGRYLRRAMGGRGEPECVPMLPHEIQSLLSTRGFLDYSGLVVEGARWEDLDPMEFERFRRFVQKSRGDEALLDLPNEELAKALGAVEGEPGIPRVRVLGLLLFGKEEALHRLLPTHEVAFQALNGSEVRVNEFFRYPLLRVMEELLARFQVRYREEEITEGLFRVRIPEYSERAFREAVANALIHRDYTRLGAVHIQWYEDRIEISNPGGFPEGVHLGNILVTPPKPRNPLLADAFKRAGIVERTGRGIDIIFAEQLRNGRPAPSYDRSTNTDVVLVLPGGQANLKFVRLVVEENKAQRSFSLDELLVLNAIWRERSVNTADAARIIQKNEDEARAVLERLLERGLLEARGERKGRIYHLSAATYRRLGLPAAYVRRRGFEPIQQEQMILQYVRVHGRITRREAAELCQIQPYQALHLLKKLVHAGNLIPKGKGRGAFYCLPEGERQRDSKRRF